MKKLYLLAAILGAAPAFTANSISNETRIGSKTLLHTSFQQQRVWIFWDGCHCLVRCVVAVRLLRGAKTWNEAAVGIRYM